MTEVCDSQYLMNNKNIQDPDYYKESKMKNVDNEKIEYAEHNKNFISKVYQIVLANTLLQKQINKINKISQPIFNIYHELLDDKINDFKDKSQELINTTKEKLTSWLYNVNIYSHLVGLWILQNPPSSENITNEKTFLKSVSNLETFKKNLHQEEIMQIATRFYEILSVEWAKLKEPTRQDIKNVLLHSVAVTIGKGLHQMDDFYANNLVHVFKEIVEKKCELMSNNCFIEVIKKLTGNIWTDDASFHKATHDFYIFAKRFTLIDLPIVTNPKSVSKAIVDYTKDMSRNYADIILNLVNNYLDTITIYLDIEVAKEKGLSPSFAHKKNLISRKLYLISSKLYSKSILLATTNKLFIIVNDYVHFRQRFDDISFFTISTISTIKNIVEPTQKFALTTYTRLYKEYKVIIFEPIAKYIIIQFDRVTKQLLVTIKILNIDLKILKERLPSIAETYEYLKEATFIIKDAVLEIKFDKHSLTQYRQKIKEQIEALYAEIRQMNIEKTKNHVSILYVDALKTLKEKKKLRINQRDTQRN